MLFFRVNFCVPNTTFTLILPTPLLSIFTHSTLPKFLYVFEKTKDKNDVSHFVFVVISRFYPFKKKTGLYNITTRDSRATF
jgi:hypothetical protein